MEGTAKTFLGLAPPKDPRPLLEEHAASCTDAGIFLPTSRILRPVKHFMSFKPLQEAGLNKKLHGDVRMPQGFQSVGGVSDSNNVRAAATPTPQKSFNKGVQQGNSFGSFLNLTNKHSFPLPSHPSRAPNSTSPQINPNVHLTNYPYGFTLVPGKAHGIVGSQHSPYPGHYAAATVQQQRGVGAAPVTFPTSLPYNTRNSSQPLPTSGQLTIFFGGMVNVYENVSLDKVQAIMSMAANGTNTTIPQNNKTRKQVNLVHPGGRVKPADPARMKPPPEAVMIRHPPPQAASVAAPPCSALCSPTSAAASPSTDHSASSSNTPDEPKGSKTTVPSENMVPVEDEPATNTTPMSRAVPMARKASLARFLEKRKERMSNLAPYASAPKPSGGSVVFKTVGSVVENHTAKLTSASGAREQPWHPARPSRGMDASFVNTELEI